MTDTVPNKSHPNAHPLETVRADIGGVLDNYLQYQLARAKQIDSDYADLWVAIGDQVKSGGKRFRPYLCVLAYEISGGNNYEEILPLAAALELFHTAMLIHDDIIDRDYTRHDQPNIAGSYVKGYSALIKDQSESRHYAHSAALLCGDLLISDAYQLIIKSSVAVEHRLKAAELIGDAMYFVSAGELLDTEAALRPPEYPDSLKIAELKTATYSCSIPLTMGAMLANATDKERQIFKQIGIDLGIAFQLADDLLGVYGDEAVTGKSSTGDIREGKRTYLLQLTLESASPNSRQEVMNIIGNPSSSSAQIDLVRKIMIDSGAKSKTETLMQAYAAKAHNGVAKLKGDAASKDRLNKFIDLAIWRSS